MDTSCGVPGCPEESGPFDCCLTTHSAPTPGGSDRYRPNDGVIDEVAIDLVVEGVRQVELTWVEAQIAVAKMQAAGLTKAERAEHLGYEMSHSTVIRAALESIRQALSGQEVLNA